MTPRPSEVHDAFVSVAQYILDRLPAEFDRAEINAGGALRVFGGRSRGYTADGNPVPALYDDPFTPIMQLRDVMYEPGTGTWFSARFVVTRAGEAEAEYDYDGEPERNHIIDTVEWVRDLRKYPRDAEYLPEWLLNAVADAYKRFPGLLEEDLAAERPWTIAANRNNR